jgi:hypothetical protein
MIQTVNLQEYNKFTWETLAPNKTLPQNKEELEKSHFYYEISAASYFGDKFGSAKNWQPGKADTHAKIQARRNLFGSVLGLICRELENVLKNISSFQYLYVEFANDNNVVCPDFADWKNSTFVDFKFPAFLEDCEHLFACDKTYFPNFAEVQDYKILTNLFKHENGFLHPNYPRFQDLSFNIRTTLGIENNRGHFQIPFEQIDLEQSIYDSCAFSNHLYNKMTTLFQEKQYI